MGVCGGCAKRKKEALAMTRTVGPNSASRVAVYQVHKDGALVSEFSNPMEARKAAAACGGRVRVTSKAADPAVQ